MYHADFMDSVDDYVSHHPGTDERTAIDVLCSARTHPNEIVLEFMGNDGDTVPTLEALSVMNSHEYLRVPGCYEAFNAQRDRQRKQLWIGR